MKAGAASIDVRNRLIQPVAQIVQAISLTDGGGVR